jgi:hypothetical protein
MYPEPFLAYNMSPGSSSRSPLPARKNKWSDLIIDRIIANSPWAVSLAIDVRSQSTATRPAVSRDIEYCLLKETAMEALPIMPIRIFRLNLSKREAGCILWTKAQWMIPLFVQKAFPFTCLEHLRNALMMDTLMFSDNESDT